jgi:hypothetical protein
VSRLGERDPIPTATRRDRSRSATASRRSG